MLCDLAVRRTSNDDGESFALRVTGKTALGPSSTGGRDTKHYDTADALLSDLESFHLTPEVTNAAAEALGEPSNDRFVDIAKDVQIPFEQLEAADIALFDAGS